MTRTGAPSRRWSHVAAWTGREMLIWGGSSYSGPRNTGGRYDPIADVWFPITMTGAPTARSNFDGVWTGLRLIVWGGCADGNCLSQLGTGGEYDPAADSWTPTATVGAPSA